MTSFDMSLWLSEQIRVKNIGVLIARNDNTIIIDLREFWGRV